MSEHELGVHSETGTRRQVIVCRPGLVHRRLTPANCQDLLFDDVFWVKQAQTDQDVFVKLMTDEGVEVLDVNDLQVETLNSTKARNRVLDQRIVPDQIGAGMISELRSWMDELPGSSLAEHLLGGLTVDELPIKPRGLFGGYLGYHGFVLRLFRMHFLPETTRPGSITGVSVNPMHWSDSVDPVCCRRK